nr:hypothetical protein [Tanacetum cinerariifolium]
PFDPGEVRKSMGTSPMGSDRHMEKIIGARNGYASRVDDTGIVYDEGAEMEASVVFNSAERSPSTP